MTSDTLVLAIADTDSYLKWSWSTIGALPAHWRREQVLINNPVMPSRQQVAAATGVPIARLSVAALLMKITRERPDVILLACTGPVIEALLSYPLLRGAHRPVVITGLPGISIPATPKAIRFRRGADLFIVHSERERQEFGALARELGIRMTFSLALLPFVDRIARERSLLEPELPSIRESASSAPTQVILAAQAKVPFEREHRRQILRAMADLPTPLRGVVKLRAAKGEAQTHNEMWPYPQLWQELVAEEDFAEDAIEFVTGSMEDALAQAVGLVTVSSTAALEAFGSRIGVLILSDFGVNAEMINLVFEGSGLLGTLDDLRAGRFHQPDEAWLEGNYFHDEESNDWLIRLTSLVEQRRRGALPEMSDVSAVRARTRAWRQLRLVLPQPLRAAALRVRRITHTTKQSRDIGH